MGRLLALWAASAAWLGAADLYSISGTVKNSVTSEPVGRALVRIGGTGVTANKIVLADMGGGFQFDGLPGGAYFLSASKPGYQTDTGSAPAPVTVGPSREGVTVRLTPLAMISGRVSDAHGEAADGVVVQALESRPVEGRRQVRLRATATTDDRGEYRMAHLPPGKYYVRAASRSGGMLGYLGETAPRMTGRESFAPVYYPNSTVFSGAMALQADAGQRVRADLSLTMLPAYRVRGQLLNYSSYQQPRLELLRSDDDVAPVRFSLNAATGRFEIQDLVPGHYLLRATVGEGFNRFRGERLVSVTDGDVSGADLELWPGIHIQGKVTVIGGTETKNNARCAVTLRSLTQLDGEAPNTVSSDEGRLDFYSVLAGRYRVEIQCHGGYVSAVAWGNQDVLEDNRVLIGPVSSGPLEISVRADGGTVTGVVLAEGAVGRVTLALVEENSSSPPRIAEAAPGAPFTMESVRPGQYKLYAFPSSAEIEYTNPQALREAGLEGQDVRVGAREKVAANVKVKAAP